MKLIDKAVQKIIELDSCKAAHIMAQALYSACTTGCPGPSLITVSAALDDENRALFCELASICDEPDFSNVDQDRAIRFVRQRFPELIPNRQSIEE